LDFWKFWAGQAVSNLGDSFTKFALPLLVFRLTGSAADLGITSALTFLPYPLFGLVIGALTDRVDRRRLMICVELLRAAVVASIPALAALHALDVRLVYGATFVNATLNVAFESCEFAAIPNLVPAADLVRANGRVQASYSAAKVAGPLLAAPLLAVVPIVGLLAADAASFLVSALTLLTVRRRFDAERRRGRPALTRDIGEGVRYVMRHPVLRDISLLAAAVNVLGSTVVAQLVFLAKGHLHAGDPQVALLYSAGSVGIVCMSLAAAPLRRRLGFSRLALGALLVQGALTIVLGLSDAYWLALPLWAAIVGLTVVFNVNSASLRQQLVPDHLLGRVLTTAAALSWSVIPVGALLGGLVVERTGQVALVYAAIGAVEVVVVLTFTAGPLRRADALLPAPAVSPAR
jgi:MFS family permease